MTDNDRWSKHRPEHDNWDAGGYCNAMVVDDDGYGDVCGYRAPTVEPPPAVPRIFGGILPYEAEVAEPNGPRIAAWVLADYADRADAIFKKWLAKHDAQVVAKALREATDERDRLVAHAERMAAALDLVLHDAHPVFGSTAKWHGGIGGQAITSHCSITQGTPPGDDWADYDMPSKPLREFLAEHPFDLEAAKAKMKQELLRDLDGPEGGQP